MNYYYDQKENERVAEARESFSGRLLTNAQFDEAMVLTGIIEREILKSGAFKEKLGDYAYAFARTENFDAVKAETILRDLFKARTGQSMNQMREDLAKREEKLPAKARTLALDYANAVGSMIEQGTKINFNRAFAHQAQAMASELGITDVGAKRLIKDEFKAAENREFYEWGKEMEEKFYKPQIEAEKQKAEVRTRNEERGRGDRSRNGTADASQRGSENGFERHDNRRRSLVGPRP